MTTLINNKIKEMNQKYPNWDSVVAEFFENDNLPETAPNEDMLDAFTELLTSLVELAKNESLAIENIVSLLDDYACKDHAKKYIGLKLQRFNNYKPLRELAEVDIYKAKYCVDLIWNSYVLRFNPGLVFDETVPLEESDFKNVAVQLDRFTDFCVDRSFSLNAIIAEIKEDSCFVEPLCEYIAEKIDGDFEKLRLNYIIHRLSVCERTLDDLTRMYTKK